MKFPFLQIIPTVGEKCARAAYEAHLATTKEDAERNGAEHFAAPWCDLPSALRDDWYRVAEAAIAKFTSQRDLDVTLRSLREGSPEGRSDGDAPA